MTWVYPPLIRIHTSGIFPVIKSYILNGFWITQAKKFPEKLLPNHVMSMFGIY